LIWLYQDRQVDPGRASRGCTTFGKPSARCSGREAPFFRISSGKPVPFVPNNAPPRESAADTTHRSWQGQIDERDSR
jgi:hypothetical protein